MPEGDDIFAEIKKVRLEHKVSLHKLSAATKIPIKHLMNIEEGGIAEPSDFIYARNIVKKYLTFFNVNPRPYLEKLIPPPTPAIAKRRTKLFVMPHILRAVFLGLTATLLIGYLFWNLEKIFRAPEIVVFSPQDKAVVADNIINVKGQAERGITLFINDQQVLLDKEGLWSEDVNLQKGANLIKISGMKRYGKERVIWLNINLEIK